MTEVMEQRRQVREKLALLASKCYSQELSACPKHPIFQPQKFINLLFALPEILIKAPDQSLPELIVDASDNTTTENISQFTQQDMLEPDNGAVFMKVLVKEKK